jgi:glycosyltransferase involved in cell wall biosynthesis
MQQVDVVMPTWNSNAWYFPIVVKHIVDALNPHHFIVVDRFSTDSTQETLRSYAGNILKVIELDVDLAIARKIGGLVADTEVVCYVDDDVIIPSCFKSIISRLVEELMRSDKIGVIAFNPCSKELTTESGQTKTSRIIRPLLHLSPMHVLRKGIHAYSRGFTFLRSISYPIACGGYYVLLLRILHPVLKLSKLLRKRYLIAYKVV